MNSCGKLIRFGEEIVGLWFCEKFYYSIALQCSERPRNSVELENSMELEADERRLSYVFANCLIESSVSRVPVLVFDASGENASFSDPSTEAINLPANIKSWVPTITCTMGATRRVFLNLSDVGYLWHPDGFITERIVRKLFFSSRGLPVFSHRVTVFGLDDRLIFLMHDKLFYPNQGTYSRYENRINLTPIFFYQPRYEFHQSDLDDSLYEKNRLVFGTDSNRAFAKVRDDGVVEVSRIWQKQCDIKLPPLCKSLRPIFVGDEKWQYSLRLADNWIKQVLCKIEEEKYDATWPDNVRSSPVRFDGYEVRFYENDSKRGLFFPHGEEMIDASGKILELKKRYSLLTRSQLRDVLVDLYDDLFELVLEFLHDGFVNELVGEKFTTIGLKEEKFIITRLSSGDKGQEQPAIEE
jgi:hypothetical protein